MKFVREQCFLAAAAQDLKRLVRFLSNAPMPTLTATTVNLPRRQKNEHNLESTKASIIPAEKLFQHPRDLS
jgi:hypothetical protein